MNTPSDLAGPPSPGTAVPAELETALDAWNLGAAQLRPVWRNGVGGLTYAVAHEETGNSADFYVKWNPQGSGESLGNEAARLRWLHGRHPAPEIAGLIGIDGAEIMLTCALPGESAVAEQWKRDPEAALRALGAGLRQLHSVALDDCPFDWGVASRMRVGRVTPTSVGEALPIDQLVICQGDPCAPNTLLGADGNFLAHVDLGRLGVADRWADLAVMSMSLAWNYSEFDEAVFWDAYGVEPDHARIDYYRGLWNAE